LISAVLYKRVVLVNRVGMRLVRCRIFSVRSSVPRLLLHQTTRNFQVLQFIESLHFFSFSISQLVIRTLLIVQCTLF